MISVKRYRRFVLAGVSALIAAGSVTAFSGNAFAEDRFDPNTDPITNPILTCSDIDGVITFTEPDVTVVTHEVPKRDYGAPYRACNTFHAVNGTEVSYQAPPDTGETFTVTVPHEREDGRAPLTIFDVMHEPETGEVSANIHEKVSSELCLYPPMDDDPRGGC